MVFEGETRYGLFYDADDYRLLEIVNKILSRGKNPALLRKLFDPGLHPRGIKELAAPRSLRLASAMIDLLLSHSDSYLDSISRLVGPPAADR